MTVIWLLTSVLIALFVIMAAGWWKQRRTGNVGWVDVYWTLGTGAGALACALVPLGGQSGTSARQWLVGALAALWSLRLGLYVAFRVARSASEDSRYVRLRQEWGAGFQQRLFWFLMVQAPVGLLLDAAILVAARNPAPALQPLDLIGGAIFAIAIAGEATADAQMQRFRTDPANKGRVCDRGLWAWSRHPNFFFDWVGWFAYPAFALLPHGSWAWGWIALVAPAVMYAVLVHGTGIPHLEREMLASRGDRYRAYQARTSAFVPLPPRRATR